MAHVYYNTLYLTKSTQAADTKGYVSVCTAMTNRIRKQEREFLEEGNGLEETAHDFSEGLKQVLQAIYANISSYIISPTLAHHIITTGSRFVFSHKTTPLLLAQMEEYLHGKNISFTLRLTKGDKKKLWPDSQVYDIIFRPDKLENICYYELVEKYKVQDLKSEHDAILRFQTTHPGYHSRGVREKTFLDVPMIYMPPFVDLYELEMNKHPSQLNESIIEARNTYALRSLILFFHSKK